MDRSRTRPAAITGSTALASPDYKCICFAAIVGVIALAFAPSALASPDYKCICFAAIVGVIALAFAPSKAEALQEEVEQAEAEAENVSLEELQESVREEEVEQAKATNIPARLEAVQLVHKQAQQFTQQQLSVKPDGASDVAVLPHVLKALAGDRPVTFGRDASSTSSDPVHMLHALGSSEDSNASEWDLKLRACPKWCKKMSAQDLFRDSEAKDRFQREAQLRIAKSLHVSKDRIHITSIREGSVHVKYTVQDLTSKEKGRILEENVSGKLKKEFDTFESMNISPAVLKLHFNLNDLDPAGDKDFGADGGATFQVGGRTYHQPASGWVRYGLKVIGKYPGGDAWLTPFRHQNNWCRAFHGTKGAAKQIAEGGFKESAGGKLGRGVYVSPFVEYAERYAQPMTVETTNGMKRFKVVLQVAVRPGTIIREDNFSKLSENDEWTVDSENVRPYGLLIKEV